MLGYEGLVSDGCPAGLFAERTNWGQEGRSRVRLWGNVGVVRVAAQFETGSAGAGVGDDDGCDGALRLQSAPPRCARFTGQGWSSNQGLGLVPLLGCSNNIYP
jgi:hypothetical protein